MLLCGLKELLTLLYIQGLGLELQISLVLFEIRIPNLVSGCIFGWWSVVCYLWVTVTLTLTSDLVYRISICFWCISLIFFDVIISNSVWECIFGRQNVTYHFMVTVTLTSDLVFRIIMFGAYLLYYAVVIPNLVCECILGWRSVQSYFWVTLTLTSDPVSRISIEFGAYVLYSLR